MNIPADVLKIIGFFPIFLFSICFHEFAHGLVAKWRGDNTAEKMGRLTLSPFAHADLFGTVIFPMIGVVTGFFFGWAKPVPVNERNLKNPKTDMFWIASAGPLSNILLAVIGALIVVYVGKFYYGQPMTQAVVGYGQVFIMTNISLAVFNALPIHPLDGGKILARFIPDSWDRWLLDKQFFLFIFLIVALNSPLAFIFHAPVRFVLDLLSSLMGVLWGM